MFTPLIRRLGALFVLLGGIAFAQRPPRSGSPTHPPPYNYAEVLKACRQASDEKMQVFVREDACAMDDARLNTITKDWLQMHATVCHEGDAIYSDFRFKLELENMKSRRDQVCAQKKNSGDALPAFESVLLAITDGRHLDPCTYDPKADNSAILNNPLYMDGFSSRKSYDAGSTVRRFEIYLEEEATPAQKACFFELIKSSLTGAEWKPRK